MRLKACMIKYQSEVKVVCLLVLFIFSKVTKIEFQSWFVNSLFSIQFQQKAHSFAVDTSPSLNNGKVSCSNFFAFIFFIKLCYIDFLFSYFRSFMSD